MGNQSFFKVAGAVPVNDLAQIKAMPGAFSGAVYNGSWDLLNPAAGVFDFSDIDGFIAEATSLGLKGIELRVCAGVHAPAWVMQTAGTVIEPDKDHGTLTGTTLTFAKFWTPAYDAALQAFQAALAATYDSNPMVRTVWAMTCTSWTGENGDIGGVTADRQALSAAGATDTLIQACLSGVFSDMSAWKVTPIGLTINPLVSVDNPTATGADENTFPLALAKQAVESWRARCVLANMGLSSTATGDTATIVKTLPTLGAYTVCQWVPPATADANTEALFAASLGYNEVQAWLDKSLGGVSVYTATEVAAWTAALPKWAG